MSLKLTEAELVDLEKILDRRSLYEIVRALSHICYLKAQHVSEAWQDARLEKRWEKAAAAFDKFSERNSIKNLP